MLIRTVRMTFKPKNLDKFLSLFDKSSSRIRNFPGCSHLDLWIDVTNPTVMTTFSLWDSEEDLTSYRESDLFKETWGLAKALFAAPAMANSHKLKRSL